MIDLRREGKIVLRWDSSQSIGWIIFYDTSSSTERFVKDQFREQEEVWRTAVWTRETL